MPTKNSPKTSNRPRRSAPTPGTGGRFGRSTPTPSAGGRLARSNPSPGGRFGLPSPGAPKRPTLGRSKSKGKSSGKSGLSGLLSSLPAAGLGKKTASKGGSKGKPALAMIAAGAGAFFGRKQMQKRKEDDVIPVTNVSPTPPAMNDTTHQSGAPRPVDTSTSPDSI
ncbi:MAG: hypothetical protein H0V22_04755 [Solirubrobacterales bacterium]|jgi:hypothetical protein|nr:hypothetical protein [Solirubrobacterales bacterium]